MEFMTYPTGPNGPEKISVRIRNISFEDMKLCYPDSPCTRQAWMETRGTRYPLVIPLIILDRCARGHPMYATDTKATDGRSVGLCSHVAEVGD
jgi:hypothetical protein